MEAKDRLTKQNIAAEVRRCRRWFKDHTAKWERLSPTVERLEYSKTGTVNCTVVVLFDDKSKTIAISGDLGNAILRPYTWPCRLSFFGETLLRTFSYVVEKMQCADRFDVREHEPKDGTWWRCLVWWQVAMHDAAHEVKDRIEKAYRE